MTWDSGEQSWIGLNCVSQDSSEQSWIGLYCVSQDSSEQSWIGLNCVSQDSSERSWIGLNCVSQDSSERSWIVLRHSVVLKTAWTKRFAQVASCLCVIFLAPMNTPLCAGHSQGYVLVL